MDKPMMPLTEMLKKDIEERMATQVKIAALQHENAALRAQLEENRKLFKEISSMLGNVSDELEKLKTL